MYGTLVFGMGPTSEAIAHYVHGGATVFFVIWSFLLWPQRKQTNMMYMLFVNMAWLAFCNLKDVVFLVDGLWENQYLTGISVTVDLLYVPVMTSFFLEVVSPGWVSLKKVLLSVAVPILFVFAFILFPRDAIYHAALIYTYLFGCAAMVIVCIKAYRHGRYIRDNYSYTEYIDVRWTIIGGVAMFLCMTVYILAFTEETWLSNAVYYFTSFVTWIYLYMLSRKHNVVEIPPLEVFHFPVVKTGAGDDNSDGMPEVFLAIKERLDECMGKDKLYLNPKLTLVDVAAAVGTNRTYLSDYLNNMLGTTFYEYINEFRVREACMIIDEARAERRTLQEIADMSGFNSMSTFNRSFVRIVGMNPSQYASRKS